MLERVPWFTGGGAAHSVEVARVLAHAATSGARGIVEYSDLQCRALTVPGNKVRIAPGVAVMPNWYPGGPSQSYIGRNASETQITIPPTDSSGPRSWLLMQRVGDPQYPGTAVPSDPNDFDYQQFVLISCSSTATDVTGADRLFPSVPIARITMPASTSTVQQAYIADLREMANPRRRRDLNTLNLTVAEKLASSAFEGEQWPNAAGWYMEIPEWASEVRIRADWGMVGMPNATQNVGLLWAQIGTEADADRISTNATAYDTPFGGGVRASLLVADTLTIPASMKGTTRYFNLRGRVTTLIPNTDAARIFADTYTSIVLDCEFLESPVQDDW